MNWGQFVIMWKDGGALFLPSVHHKSLTRKRLFSPGTGQETCFGSCLCFIAHLLPKDTLGPLSREEHCNECGAHCWLSKTAAEAHTSLIKACRAAALQCRDSTLCHPDSPLPFFLSQTHVLQFRFPQQHLFRKKKQQHTHTKKKTNHTTSTIHLMHVLL